MFRPTHIVILFAVVLCATAFPADPSGTEGLRRTPEETGLSPKSVQGPLGKSDEDGVVKQGDLDTDATSHWGYAYYGPRWGYYGPGWGARFYSWGPY